MSEMVNPFEILGLPVGATKKEILEATARALRERRHGGLEIAQAQRSLLDPRRAALAELLHCFSLPAVELPHHPDPSPTTAGAGLAYLSRFRSDA
ncbi:MAG: hypothetical protein HYV63_08670 [Candidatus Schekmanbacteria bacterium]|nr:hypothetical protein [Candidatus Schekmanbacteria bacterium]